MPGIRKQRALAAATVLLALFTSASLYGENAPAAIDATLFTTYTSSATSVNWIVCGSTTQTEGCYASGSLGPFGSVGALMEGAAATKGDVVTRAIYVLDIGAGSGGTGVNLSVYKKTDTVTAETDTVSVTLTKTVALPLVGGSGALCSMAANATFVFAGTNQSSEAAEVQKFTFKVSTISAFDSNVTSITADAYGYVTVTQGDGFSVIGPTGELEEDGGGSPFMLNTMAGVLPSTLAGSSENQPVRQVGYKAKAAANVSKQAQ